MIQIVSFLIIIFFYSGCINNSKSLNTEKSIRWEESEFKELSQKMVQNILLSKKIDFSNKIFYTFDKIRNDTHDQIDTDLLKSKLIKSLTKSSKFTFLKEKESSRKYLFHGKISSIFKKNSTEKDMFFNFNLTLLNSKNSIIVWSHDIEIRKIYKRPMFSW